MKVSTEVSRSEKHAERGVFFSPDNQFPKNFRTEADFKNIQY